MVFSLVFVPYLYVYSNKKMECIFQHCDPGEVCKCWYVADIVFSLHLLPVIHFATRTDG